MQPFAIDIPLPPGVTLVEASAGTGKTWSIERLVARLVTEDPPGGGEAPTIDQVLVVTFTKAATAELRDRVRRVLAAAIAALEAVRDDPNPPRPDDLGFAVLAGTVSPGGAWTPLGGAVLDRRLARLRRAVRDFDTASIFTIHGFCQRVLGVLAFESRAAFDAELVEDASALLREVSRDWFQRVVVHQPLPVFRWLTGPARLGIERCVGVTAACVAHRDGPTLPGETLDWQGALRELAERAGALGERLAGAEGDAIDTELHQACAARAFHAARVNAEKLHGARDEVVAWLREGGLPPGPEPRKFFGHAFLQSALNKGRSFASHALLHDIDGLHDGLPDGLQHAPLADLARFARQEFARRLAAGQQSTFDDLLHQVRDGLDRAELIDGLRERFKVALIDEFQDTDAVQWDIFRTVFGEPAGAARLLLIGDPKQAIYGFRGADVSVYARARASVVNERQFTMTVNHRSDQPLVRAVAHLLDGAPNVFVNPEIAYVPVDAKELVSRLTHDGTPVHPVELRWFTGESLGLPEAKVPSNIDADNGLPGVVAADVAAFLGLDHQLRDERGGTRPLRASDIAVLVSTNKGAAAVQAALLGLGVPAIIGQSGSVFDSEEAGWVAAWLAALAEGNASCARALAATPAGGWTATALAASREERAPPGAGSGVDAAGRWIAFTEWLSRQAEVAADKGIALAFAEWLYARSAPDDRSVLERVAALPGAERRLTNLRHLAELLHRAAARDRLGPVELARWLAAEREPGQAEREASELRLESDADAVVVQTMHKSKGLEYPVVFLPGLADGRLLRGTGAIRFRRDAPAGAGGPAPGGRSEIFLDLRGAEGAADADVQAAKREALEERQRLLYVALTRAKHHVVLYAGPVNGKDFDVGDSPLGLVLHGRDDGTADPWASRWARARARVSALLRDDPGALRADADALAASSGGLVVLSDVAAQAPAHLALPDGSAPVADPPGFARDGLDTLWRRESYSRLVRDRHADIAASLVNGVLPEDPREHGEVDDDDPGANGPGDDDAPALASPGSPAIASLPLTGFPGGAEAGSWVHGVFEHLDFSAGSRGQSPAPKPGRGTLAELVRSQGLRQGFTRADHDEKLIAALPSILQTPLGSALGDCCLGDLSPGRRLDELGFDLAVGPGEDWAHHRPVAGEELAALLGQARGDDPMPAGYLDQVRTMGFRPLAGFLIGFIDLVFCAPVDGREQWFVADYKTNTLGMRDPATGRVALSLPAHYSRDFMAREVARKHYYIQYLLYIVALHRYLRWRLPGYDYARDVGGAAYLFVRGMVGPGTCRDAEGRINGVFIDKPPASVIEGIDRLLARVEVLS
ncbi:MAG: UvrD-helicase domain-containing protein [Deltaproteobacteria bacterium]|nr:UvrD-helicase domain-containing protein [Deltaproteobacteria bacterium]